MARPTSRLALAFTFLVIVGVLVSKTNGQCLSGCTCQANNHIACSNSSVCPQDLHDDFYVRVSLTSSKNCGHAIARNSFSSLVQLEILRLVGFQNYTVISDSAFADTKLVDLTITQTSLQNLTANSLSGVSSLTSLDLSHNAIGHVPDGTFKDLRELEHLRLNHNQLTSLSEGLFVGLAKLTTLDLEHNHIGELSPNCFHPLTSLRSLKLSFNRLTALPANLLTTVPILTLPVDNNQLVTIHPEAFSQSRLVGLKLENNTLRQFPGKALQKLPGTIALLYLGNNNIVKIESGDAVNLTLGRVVLDNNPLQSVDAGGFSGSTVENLLSLAGTKLTSLPREMREVLRANASLTLRGLSGWRCDCGSLWLAEFLANSNASTSSQPACRNTSRVLTESVEAIKTLCSSTTTYVFSAPPGAATATPTAGRPTLTGTTLEGVSAPTSASTPTTVSGFAAGTAACFVGLLFVSLRVCHWP